MSIYGQLKKGGSQTDILRSGGQYDLFGKVYSFLKKWANALPSSDGDWARVVDEADALGATYRGTPLEALAVALIYATVNELERLYRTA